MRLRVKIWDKKNKRMLGPVEIEDALFSYGQNYDHITKYEAQIILLTGLRDSRHKEVAEGDIIKGKFKGSAQQEKIEVCPSIDGAYHWYSELEDMDFEIIGNIYQNPELINLLK